MPSRFLRLPTPSHAGSAGHARDTIEDHLEKVIFYGERRGGNAHEPARTALLPWSRRTAHGAPLLAGEGLGVRFPARRQPKTAGAGAHGRRGPPSPANECCAKVAGARGLAGVLGDIIYRFAYRRDLLGIFVADLQVKLLLKRHDHFDEVE